MELLLTFLGVRSLLASRVGIVLLLSLCLGVIAIPLTVAQPHFTSSGFVAAFFALLLVRRFINLKK